MIRDDQGAVKKAGAGSEPFLQHAFHAELLGCLEGLKMAAQLGMAHVVVEIDAQMVKGAVEVEDYQLSSMGGIITEIKHMKVM
jgi:ribonuclease HI